MTLRNYPRLRAILKGLVPPLVLDVLRGRPIVRKPIWTGVYDSPAALGLVKTSYDTQTEVEKHAGWTRQALETQQAGSKLFLWHSPMATVAALLVARQGRVRVLDYGGATGRDYVQLLDNLPTGTVDYHVVDLPGMCAAGRAIFAGVAGIHFHERLPRLTEPVDIVYARGVLQYAEDYQQLLGDLVGVGAAYVVLSHTPTGEVPTYVSKQCNLKGIELPYWFLNLTELRHRLEAFGYLLVYHAKDGEDYDQSNFPPTHRIHQMRNLIFARKTTN